MAFDVETLKGILSNAETAEEDKIKSIISEHEADINGLKQKNEQLIAGEKKLKEQLKAEQDKAAEAVNKAASLEEELKKNSPEENRKMYEARLAEVDLKHKAELEELAKDRDALRESHFTRLRNDGPGRDDLYRPVRGEQRYYLGDSPIRCRATTRSWTSTT